MFVSIPISLNHQFLAGGISENSGGLGLNSKASVKPCSAQENTEKWANVDLAQGMS